MKCPVHQLKKVEIFWLSDHYCKAHGMPYLQHYNCYLRERHKEINIGFLDIESSDLHADFGYVFSYCILPLHGKLISRCIRSSEVKDGKRRDKRLLEQFCKDVRNFQTLVVYFGRDGKYRHDIPFLRTRAVKWGIKDFPKWKEIKVQDVYDIIKQKFKLKRSGQINACSLFGIRDRKPHPINWDIWQDAMCGSKEALDYILLHNKEDVKDLKALWKKVVDYKQSLSST